MNLASTIILFRSCAFFENSRNLSLDLSTTKQHNTLIPTLGITHLTLAWLYLSLPAESGTWMEEISGTNGVMKVGQFFMELAVSLDGLSVYGRDLGVGMKWIG